MRNGRPAKGKPPMFLGGLASSRSAPPETILDNWLWGFSGWKGEGLSASQKIAKIHQSDEEAYPPQVLIPPGGF
ncbi:MAG: hypothetical protein JWP25_2140 [Bradyrhizobium sp.]|nr:hypothetical protein [Bradyrhizobium sp.]